MKIEIVHNYQNAYQWDIFYVQLVDESKPDGEKIRASASGDWKFVSRVVGGWVDEFKVKVS